MAILTPAEQKSQAAVDKAVRRSHRSDAETAMRDVLEQWCRDRYPGARLFHELVMDRGKVRADMAAIQTGHIAAFEIKGPNDDTARLVHQIALYRLAVPELWIVTAGKHTKDAEMIRYLLPSVGLLVVRGLPDRWVAPSHVLDRAALSVEVLAEASRFEPLPEALLQLAWVAELTSEVRRHGLIRTVSGHSHAKLVEAMQRLAPADQMESVCRQLRARETLFRADPPVPYWNAAADGEDLFGIIGEEEGRK